MPVEIKIYHENAHETLKELRVLSGGLFGALPPEALAVPPIPQDIYAEAAAKLQSSTKIVEQEVAAATDRIEADEAATSESRREPGKPAPGKARRTKEEIAADEAYFASVNAQGAENSTIGTSEETDAASANANSPSGERQAISSGDERISPEDEADAAQDAADEAAETERNGGLVPRERLRKALGSLGIKAGVEAVKPGGLIGMTIDQVPEDQIEDMIAKIETFKAASAITPELIENVKRAEEAQKTATRDDLMQAMLDYAEVFDGTRNPADAKLAQVDAGKVFELIFGEGVTKLSAVPTDGYDKAIAGIREAIEKNPYGRERKNG